MVVPTLWSEIMVDRNNKQHWNLTFCDKPLSKPTPKMPPNLRLLTAGNFHSLILIQSLGCYDVPHLHDLS